MLKLLSVTSLALILNFSNVFAGDHNPASIIPLLNTSKMSLLEAIDYAEKTSGIATSAKFEVEDGKLMASVYTVPEGLKVEAEKATLTEISGEANGELAKLGKEVFADKEHIARASVHLTVFQLSKFSLKQAIALALKKVPGTPIDVRNPMIRNQRPVADVVVVKKDGSSAVVTVDLFSGKTKI